MSRPELNERKRILSICTAARGGMRAVLESYFDLGLLEHETDPVVWTHDEGGSVKKAALFISSMLHIFFLLLLHGRSYVVHCHVSMRGSFWRKGMVCLLARGLRTPVILHMHGSQFEAFWAECGSVSRWIIKRVLTAANCVLVLGDHWKKVYSSIAPSAKVIILPNFVKLASANKRSEVDRNLPHSMLFLGYVGYRKGIYDLIDAIAQCGLSPEVLRVRVAGNGEVEAAKIYAATKAVEGNFEFLGWVSGEEKSALLAKVDSFVLPSRNEGLPISLLEVMVRGIPVVTTKVGAIEDLIPSRDFGWLIEPGDITALSEAIKEVVLNHEESHRRGLAGRRNVVANFTSEVVCGKLKDIYARY